MKTFWIGMFIVGLLVTGGGLVATLCAAFEEVERAKAGHATGGTAVVWAMLALLAGTLVLFAGAAGFMLSRGGRRGPGAHP
jgi:hypothetical protein